MIIGVPKEIKTREYRVGMTPAGVRSLTSRGHKVLVESGRRRRQRHQRRRVHRAGRADRRRRRRRVGRRHGREGQGAAHGRVRLLPRGPHPLHVPAPRRRAASSRRARRSEGDGVAYETIQLDDGIAPAAQPDERGRGAHGRAGRRDVPREGARRQGRSPRRRARHAARARRHPRRRRRRPNAATIAIGMGAQVTVLDVRADTMAYLEDVFGGAIETLYSNPMNIEEACSAPTSSSAPSSSPAPPRRSSSPRSSSVAWRRAASSSTSRSTRAAASRRAARRRTTTPPTRCDGVVHYCVANMPGAVAQTSTWALTNTTIAYALKIAEQGLVAAAKADQRARQGDQHVRRPRHVRGGRAGAQARVRLGGEAAGVGASYASARATLNRVSSRVRLRAMRG